MDSLYIKFSRNRIRYNPKWGNTLRNGTILTEQIMDVQNPNSSKTKGNLESTKKYWWELHF